MATPRDSLEDLARDLDMVVFRLERDLTPDQWNDERRRVRKDLERLRDRIEDAARKL